MTAKNDLMDHAMRLFPPPERALERVTERQRIRERNRRVAAACIGLSVLLAGLLVGATVLRSDQVPAFHPTPTISPETPARHNGSIGVFGFLDGVRVLAADGSLRGFAARCQGSCTLVPGADWSPDGTYLAFAAECAGGCGTAGDPYHGIHVVDTVTGADRQVVQGGEYFGRLSWSPDGTRIAFVDRDQIEVVNADGSGRNPVVTTGPRSFLGVSKPSWSPDGTQIVFSTHGHVYVIGVDGSSPTFLVSGVAPAWSPDGTRIIYLDGFELRSMTPDARDDALVERLSFGQCSIHCRRDESNFDIEWSPDGSKVVVMVPARRVYLVDVAEHRAKLLRNAASNTRGLTWQPVP